MSTNDIPDWAKNRAMELANSEGTGRVALHTIDATGLGRALARYIAEHEEAPVDPLVDALMMMVPIRPEPPQGQSYAEHFADELREELAKRGLQIVEATK